MFYQKHQYDNIYCPEEPSKIHMEGIRDSEVYNIGHSYFIYEVIKCQEKNRERTDEKVIPTCKDPSNPFEAKCARKYALLPNGDPIDPPCATND